MLYLKHYFYIREQIKKKRLLQSIMKSVMLGYFENILLLAHLSTKCSWWAIVVSGCPSSVVVRRASSVVRQHLMFTL